LGICGSGPDELTRCLLLAAVGADAKCATCAGSGHIAIRGRRVGVGADLLVVVLVDKTPARGTADEVGVHHDLRASLRVDVAHRFVLLLLFFAGVVDELDDEP
jgi:hypothetical protein